ncbi:hypothetical protein Tco_1022649, partial [Tanacetum coccineum]
TSSSTSLGHRDRSGNLAPSPGSKPSDSARDTGVGVVKGRTDDSRETAVATQSLKFPENTKKGNQDAGSAMSQAQIRRVVMPGMPAHPAKVIDMPNLLAERSAGKCMYRDHPATENRMIHTPEDVIRLRTI